MSGRVLQFRGGKSPEVGLMYFSRDPGFRDGWESMLTDGYTFLADRVWVFDDFETATAMGSFVNRLASQRPEWHGTGNVANDGTSFGEKVGYLALIKAPWAEFTDCTATETAMIQAANTELTILRSPLILPLELAPPA